jgi:serine protease Do
MLTFVALVSSLVVAATGADPIAPDPFSVERRTAVVAVAERVAPAVVSVLAEQVVQTRVRSDSFLDDFMTPRYRQEYATTSLGSGVLIDPHHVITNNHVVMAASRVRIALSDRRELPCTVVGTDANLDLAVLRVETSEDLPHVSLADSRDVMVGETVIAIGNPFGLGHTVTAGVVSALHRTIYAPGALFHDFLQTDASINPGNSGGPLLDVEGRLVGINTAIYGRAQGIGFAIPVNRAGRIAREIIALGKVRQGYIGVDVKPLNRDDAKARGFARPMGVLVAAVTADTPAAKAGLKTGDVILEVEGFKIIEEIEYSAKMRDYVPGTTLDLLVHRDGALTKVTLDAAEAPVGFGRQVLERQLGIKAEPLTPELKTKYGITVENGFVVTQVRARSLADKAEISEGDVLRFVGNNELKDEGVLDTGVLDGRRAGSMVFNVLRKSRVMSVGFPI